MRFIICDSCGLHELYLDAICDCCATYFTASVRCRYDKSIELFGTKDREKSPMGFINLRKVKKSGQSGQLRFANFPKPKKAKLPRHNGRPEITSQSRGYRSMR
jgi:hypothetical protein